MNNHKNNLDQQFNELKQTIVQYIPTPDLELLDNAWEFAKLAHTSQKRLSGEPYASHSLETARILVQWKLDIPSIIAGLLHDTIEDGGAKRQDIVSVFGENVALLVDGVTKVSGIRLRGSRDEEFVENLRKMFLAMAKDLRVVLIKLADRLHNMRTLDVLPAEKQVKIAKETLDIYAPLAERLGMGEVKTQLDDLSFPYVYPKECKKVEELAKEQYKKAREHLIKMKRTLLASLAQEKIKARIDGRKKHLYSMWKKLERPEIAWDSSKIHDIVAMRILVDTIPDCYTVLGAVHRTYKPVPHLGISDFIAQPKPNGYQSIHTKVFGPEGRIVEVQIKTFDMHEENEHGVAAHWYIASLKTQGKITSQGIDAGTYGVRGSKLAWVRQLADWQNELTDPEKFLEAVKFDALSERIFVFSPKGDVYDLPVGATPIDFACSVHTSLGKFVKAAIVNGKMAPLNYKLSSGDVVEVVKTKNPKNPSSDWLDFVVTNTARREINKHLRN